MDEFIDAYSDDQIYLEIMEDLINKHPVEGNMTDNVKYSSFCRLWIVMMVGGIEMVIKKWFMSNQFGMTDIAAYFDNGTNEERLQRLSEAFRIRGLNPNPLMFEDYLACKYIRNAYVHGEWNEKQKHYVESKNFPSDLMSFTPSHHKRVKAAYYHLLNLLGMSNAMNNIINSKS